MGQVVKHSKQFCIYISVKYADSKHRVVARGACGLKR